MGGSAGGVHEGGAALPLLDHLLVFLAGLDAGHAEGDDLDAAQLAPLFGKLLIQGLGQLGGVAGQGRIANAHLTDAGERRLQRRHHLGAHLALEGVAGVLIFHISADVGVKQDGVDDAVAVLAEAPDAHVDVDACPLVHHTEGHRAGSAVLVAHQLLGVDVVDALVVGGLTAEAEPLADLRKDLVDVLGQTLAQQRGLGAGVVGVLARLGAEVHHLALLHDEGALALGHRHDGAIGDDVLGAVTVRRAPGDLLLSLDGQHLRRESAAIKVFLPLVAHHSGCCTQCRFDKTHKPYLLFLPAVLRVGFPSVYHKTGGEKRKPLHFLPDGCRILPTNKYRGACKRRLRGSSQTSTLGGCLWTASAPDADNAAVGSHNAAYGFLQETPQRASPVFCPRLRGSALSLGYMLRWEAVFRRERRPMSLDRFFRFWHLRGCRFCSCAGAAVCLLPHDIFIEKEHSS